MRERLAAEQYLNYLEQIFHSKTVISPRGQEVKEVQDLQLIVLPEYPFMSFKARKYPVDYFKKEMRWYLGANKHDCTIMELASIWSLVVNPDNTFNSNYGQYWFGEQHGLWTAFLELVRDRDSRRAIIPMLRAEHLEPHVKDVVCTETVGFRIRDDQLSMWVHMRSSDAIYGLGTDIPAFAFVFRLMYAMLEMVGISLTPGNIMITAASAHIYAKHYDMVQQILTDSVGGYESIGMPWCSGAEALQLIAQRGKGVSMPFMGELSQWLYGIKG